MLGALLHTTCSCLELLVPGPSSGTLAKLVHILLPLDEDWRLAVRLYKVDIRSCPQSSLLPTAVCAHSECCNWDCPNLLSA
jgi:hypothetical protein